MVGTRLVHACLAVCILTAEATPISAAGTPPRAMAALPTSTANFVMPAAQARAAQLQSAKRVPFGTDVGLKGVVAAMLVAYQLRRKHRALRTQPFSF